MGSFIYFPASVRLIEIYDKIPREIFDAFSCTLRWKLGHCMWWTFPCAKYGVEKLSIPFIDLNLSFVIVIFVYFVTTNKMVEKTNQMPEYYMAAPTSSLTIVHQFNHRWRKTYWLNSERFTSLLQTKRKQPKVARSWIAKAKKKIEKMPNYHFPSHRVRFFFTGFINSITAAIIQLDLKLNGFLSHSLTLSLSFRFEFFV